MPKLKFLNFHTRKWIKLEDLHPNGSLFGGSLQRWIDEEATIYSILQLNNPKVVTKYMSEINFLSLTRIWRYYRDGNY